MMQFFRRAESSRSRSIAQHFEGAAEWHRKAIGYVKDAEAAAQVGVSDSRAAAGRAARTQRMLAEKVANLADSGLPGWLGAPLTYTAPYLPVGRDAVADQESYVRVGDAGPVLGIMLPVVAPFIGTGHLVIDKDCRDLAAGQWLRGVLLRSFAALPSDQLRVLTVDGATLGEAFAPFRRLFQAGIWAVPATDAARFRAVIEQAERHVTAVLAGQQQRPEVLLVAVAALPAGINPDDLDRLARLARTGVNGRTHMLMAGWPPAGVRPGALPRLDNTTYLTTASTGRHTISQPAALRQLDVGSDGTIRLDSGPSSDFVDTVCQRSMSAAAWAERADFGLVTLKRFWRESSISRLSTVIGRSARGDWTLVLDDTTPHMLIGGRSGAGKTNFLLVLLCAMATRYAPDELVMYLLDFKEGVSFSAFTPSARESTWLPHACSIGLESDREYGMAVLAALAREMNERARKFKSVGVTSLERYRRAQQGGPMPRLLVVIDEFQVLLAGTDHIARDAVSTLEHLARQGRSHGIHLVLASQTIAGIDALNAKRESIFGQFPLRVALPGGGGVLQPGNTAADAIAVGTTIINSLAGVTEGNAIVNIPRADHDSVAAVVRSLWQHGSAQHTEPPAVFDGRAEYRLEDSSDYRALTPLARKRRALVGRAVDIGLPAASFVLEQVPGRHLAVLGTSLVGADILHAATLSLACQHQPGSARFAITGLVTSAEPVIGTLIADLTALQHDVANLVPDQLSSELADLAQAPAKPTYVVAFGMDTVMSTLAERRSYGRTGLDDLRTVLRRGPLSGVHVLSWWLGARRFSEAIGGSAGREDVACLVAVNVPGTELAPLVGDHTLSWHPRVNRCLLLDLHDQRRLLMVPFVRPGRHGERDEGRVPPLGRAG